MKMLNDTGLDFDNPLHIRRTWDRFHYQATDVCAELTGANSTSQWHADYYTRVLEEHGFNIAGDRLTVSMDSGAFHTEDRVSLEGYFLDMYPDNDPHVVEMKQRGFRVSIENTVSRVSMTLRFPCEFSEMDQAGRRSAIVEIIRFIDRVRASRSILLALLESEDDFSLPFVDADKEYHIIGRDMFDHPDMVILASCDTYLLADNNRDRMLEFDRRFINTRIIKKEETQ